MSKTRWPVFLAFMLLAATCCPAAPPLKALIVDGQNNHDWRATTPILKKLLEETGLIVVDVQTSPPKGSPFAEFKPSFAGYQVIVLNYNGDSWSEETKAGFEKYVRTGGGLVIYHAANNAFPEWKEFNEMIGLGGWGNRDEKWGPYVRYRDGRIVLDNSPGTAGHHGPQHSFALTVREHRHPITAGLPRVWMHEKDELYDQLRGPAKNMTLLATAFSDPKYKGTGEEEPMLFTIHYGKGRVFHTALGHGPEAMRCVGFIVTLQRGTEWAASGKVRQKLPPDFPSADKVSIR